MTDTTNTDSAAPEDATADQEAPKETDWKAEAKKWEARSKANAAKAKEGESAAQRLAEIEESQKTELQKWQERAERAEAAAARFESERQVAAWKTEVADQAGVPASALRGSTLEELQAHAEELKPLLSAASRGPYVPSPGNIPDTAVSTDGAFARSIFGQAR